MARRIAIIGAGISGLLCAHLLKEGHEITLFEANDWCGSPRMSARFGHQFNPVCLYYCFDAAGERVEKVVAEVRNTPWRERHCYVLDGLDATIAKDFHVSQLLGMDSVYRVRLTAPGELLRVHMESRRDGRVGFDATLALSRRELSAWPLLRYPFMAARVVAGIYAHASLLRP
jgi:uncharacterized protein